MKVTLKVPRYMSETGGKPLLKLAVLVQYKCSVSPQLRIKAQLKMCHFLFLRFYHPLQQQQGCWEHSSKASEWTLESVCLCTVCPAALVKTLNTYSITHLFRFWSMCACIMFLIESVAELHYIRYYMWLYALCGNTCNKVTTLRILKHTMRKKWWF